MVVQGSEATMTQESKHTWRETIEAEGEHVIKKLEEVIAEGDVRKVVITHEGRTVAEFPLTVGVVGVVLAPVLAAIAAIVALAADYKIHVEREKKSD